MSRFAIIIGVDHYENPAWRLTAAVEDALAHPPAAHGWRWEPVVRRGRPWIAAGLAVDLLDRAL